MSEQRTPVRASIRRHLAIGVAAVFLLVGGVGGWAATTQLLGALIAQGQLVVSSNVKKVQHPIGGIVAELLVREGDHVKAGDLLVRLDDTQVGANLGIVNRNLDELAARQARDEAERDGVDAITFSKDLLARKDDPVVARLIKGEENLFQIRRNAREGQKAQLRERISQLKEEIAGQTTQYDARGSQVEWIKKELEGVYELWRKNLVAFSRVTNLEREAARLEGERGQIIASTAQSKGKISELELQIIQIDQDMRAEVGRELSDIRGKISELLERKVAAEDQLRRIEIRAPLDGFVLQLNVHTVGGVITQGEPIMLIVPEQDALTVEAKIQPQDRDQVYVGQKAFLRFSAFNAQTTPQIEGTVIRVAADVTTDQKSGVPYYLVGISISDEERALLGGLKLVAGMPVEAFIQTGERNVLSYLIKPLSDHLMRTFRDR